MERKIGEVFTYNSKTYQVVEVESDEECKGCAFEFSSCCTSLFKHQLLVIVLQEVRKIILM